jgi:hypothetical protein
MKKIYTPKPHTPVVTEHRLFRRFVRKMFGSILKHQDSYNQHEVIQRLQNLEYKIEMMARAMSRQARRK